VSVVRAALLLAALAAGAVLGVLGTYVHLLTAGSGHWPVGLLLALLLVAAGGRTLRALPLPAGGPPAALVGWLAVVLLAMSRRREGDLLVVWNLRGVGWLGLGLLVLTGCLLAPAGRRRGPRVRVLS
jgi:hypothetical protein